MNEHNNLVEHLFRRQWGEIVASLTRRFGIQNLELIEDAVQESIFAALKSWPTRGVPDNPSAWLQTVSKNRLLDLLRSSAKRTKSSLHGELSLEILAESRVGEAVYRDEISDDYLRLIFLCCDPQVPPDGRIALTLQLACGFSISEIAGAFLTTEATIAKRIYRAKAKLVTQPPSEEGLMQGLIEERLDSVLEVIYLLFSEGYSAHTNERLIRQELCAEALRLVRLLASNKRTSDSTVCALGSLLAFQCARLSSRVGLGNELLVLEDQDRSLWNQELIGEGMCLLEKSASGSKLSRYHLEAGIAACHASAPTYLETDWTRILYYYDQLLDLFPSEIVRLNRAVAFSMVHGAELAVKRLQGDQTLKRIENYYLYHATLADLTRRNGDLAAAAGHYRRALELTSNQTEREFLLRRLGQCEPAN